MKPFLRYWMPVFALCAIIFLQSSFAAPDIMPGWPFQDKAVHAVVYGLLGGLCVRAFNTLDSWHGRKAPLWFAGVVLATLYGLSDEWHQSFVSARSAEGADLLADFIGSAIGSWMYLRLILSPVHAGPSDR